jgi:small-conductance mechanosensitive channel
MASVLLAGSLAALLATAGPPASPRLTAGEAEAPLTVGTIRFRGADLFTVRAPLAGRDPRQRAEAIGERLASAGSAGATAPVTVLQNADSSDILVGDRLIVSVTDGDAAPLGRTRQQYAADIAALVGTALARDAGDRTLQGLLSGLGYGLGATAVLLAALWLGRKGRRRLLAAVRAQEGKLIRPLRVQRTELLSSSRATALLVSLVDGAALLLGIVAVLAWLEVTLGSLPWTRDWARRTAEVVLGAVWSVLARIVEYLPNLVYIALIVFVARYVVRGIHLLFREIGRGTISLPGFHRDWSEPTFKIVRFLVIALAAVVIFPYLPGAGSQALQGVSIFLGVLFSLGSTSAVANLVGGIVITYMRPFAIGDRVKIGETIGDVVEMGVLVVRIRTIKNENHSIPNASVLTNHMVNFSTSATSPGLILHTTVTIGYDAPWRQVDELLVAAALATDGLQREPAPFVLQTSLDDFYVSYEINAYTDRANESAAIYSRLHRNIQDRFNEAGVEIMSPHYNSLRDGNEVTIPPGQRAASYVAPSFRVAVEPSGGSSRPEKT